MFMKKRTIRIFLTLALCDLLPTFPAMSQYLNMNNVTTNSFTHVMFVENFSSSHIKSINTKLGMIPRRVSFVPGEAAKKH